mmetsp:Transcript_67700/g.201329  ORF Transcript_67700/g.201329 Transcript_67700/m.201329 type:complete len:200 (-) Transcript_67700:64-663(-)
MASADVKATADTFAKTAFTSFIHAPFVRLSRSGLKHGAQELQLEDVPLDKIVGSKVFGIYFAAQWCPPCKHFTQLLAEGLTRIHLEHGPDSFGVLLVPRDRSRAAWTEHLVQHPWPSLSWGHPAGKALREVFTVTHLPRLVVVDAQGGLICRNARGGHAGFGFCCNPLAVFAELLRRKESGVPAVHASEESSDDEGTEA